MKTIEEKAKAYDRVSKEVKDFFEGRQKMYSDINKTLEYLFPELAESEDERIRKEIIQTFKRFVKCVEDGHDTPEAKNILLKDIEKKIAWLEKQGAQNLADNPETAFHEGDWIVQENIGVYKVIEVCESWYEVIDIEDNHYSISFDKEYMCHFWTIQDAKDGDVLCSNQIIVLFKQWEDNTDYSFIIAHAGIDVSGKLQITNEHWLISNESKPATKEQRNTLMKAMADAGYTFDFEKKELKKIEQKPTTIDIDKMVDDYANNKEPGNEIFGRPVPCMVRAYRQGLNDAIHQNIPRYSIGDVLCDKSCTTLNKEEQPNFEIIDIRNGMYICDKGSFPISQQDEYELVAKKIEQKLVWNEKDEHYKNIVISVCNYMVNNFENSTKQYEDTIDWIKSLKERIKNEKI